MRRIALLIIICITSSMFTSCYDAKELDDLLHIIIIGVDRGVTDQLRLTVMFPTLKSDSGGGSGGGSGNGSGQDGYGSLTIDAPSFFTGIDMINSTLSRRLNFMHTELMVISEDVAKSGMLGEFLAPIIRFRQIRRSMHVYISKEPAMEVVSTFKPLIGTAMSKNIHVMTEEAGTTGFFSHITLENFYENMKSTYQQPIVPMCALNNPENFKKNGENIDNEFKTEGEYYAGDLPFNAKGGIQLFGLAVFDGDKMVGKLTGGETRLMMMANGDFRMAFYTMPDPSDPSLIISLDVRRLKKPSIKIKFDNGKPIIDLKIELEGDLLAVQSRINYEQPELKPLLERAFEKQIKEGLGKLIEKSIDMKTDIFGFGRTAVKQFPTIQKWEDYNWISKFQNAEIKIDVDFIIRRTGTQLRSSPVINTEGKE